MFQSLYSSPFLLTRLIVSWSKPLSFDSLDRPSWTTKFEKVSCNHFQSSFRFFQKNWKDRVFELFWPILTNMEIHWELRERPLRESLIWGEFGEAEFNMEFARICLLLTSITVHHSFFSGVCIRIPQVKRTSFCFLKRYNKITSIILFSKGSDSWGLLTHAERSRGLSSLVGDPGIWHSFWIKGTCFLKRCGNGIHHWVEGPFYSCGRRSLLFSLFNILMRMAFVRITIPLKSGRLKILDLLMCMEQMTKNAKDTDFNRGKRSHPWFWF